MTFDFWHIHLCFALLAFLLLPLRGRPWPLQLAVLAGLLVFGFVPVGELPLALYVRTLIPEPSVVGLLALVWAALVRLELVAPLAARQRFTLLIVFGALGLILYPAALGIGPFDPYRLGFSPQPMILAVGVLALALLVGGNLLGTLLLSLATLAFGLDLLASENYWDYLLDPFVALYCWFALLGHGVRRFRRAGPRELAR